MALDGVYLRHIKQEIEKEALGARVNQIYQPNRDELVMTLRTYSGTKKLLLSARANSPRVNFCENTPENPAQPPMFCMLLRKRLGGGKLIAVRQLRCDRVLFLDFACVNELGDEVFLTVACEIMGMYSNIIVLNRDTQLIIDALKRVDLTVSSKRLILPNLKYELPEEQDKLSLLTASPEEIAEKIKSFPAEMALSKAALQAIQGISPIVARELEYRVTEGATNRLEGALYDKLLDFLFYLKGTCEQCSGVPYTVYREDGKPMDVAFLEIRQYGGFMRVERGDGFNAVIDRFYDERDRQERMRVKTHSLNKLLRNHRDRVARRLQKQHTELQQCADREALRIRGDLLQANLYRVERGADSVTVENFYDENGGTLTIRLNPAISPAANAQRFYKDYQKAKNAESFLTEQLAKGEEELRYFDSVLDEVSRAESERELAQIREELTEQGYLRKPKGRQPKPTALPPLEFESSDGFKIYVGRNNRQNDKLTLKTAAKNDVWLHTKEIHGSHVIIVTDGREVSDTAILEAARLAVYHSKARGSSNVPVDYTQVKNVSKPSGAKPGMVIYVKNKTVYV
ncbi:Predicted component of the ribosome quality control (RQC) complex, YloA/Tae2 family, contains fibronectin-binding (FbpA) and DUF814 domains [Ruminococcaceae bacterium P7]|nr:Predicted component of the ribosome quality control (RQC) complex, YloA/Tae2 family, contains fibronectin-binding (FbpA) and DUF814 domains [Ruminococcaceae bacterium P7]